MLSGRVAFLLVAAAALPLRPAAVARAIRVAAQPDGVSSGHSHSDERWARTAKLEIPEEKSFGLHGGAANLTLLPLSTGAAWYEMWLGLACVRMNCSAKAET